MQEKIKKFFKKILINLQKMFDKILYSLWIKRKIKEVNFDEIFDDFYNSDIWDSTMILDELWELVKKVLKTWIMQEFNGNTYSLEIYPEKVILINNFNNKISKITLDDFVAKMKSKKAD